MFRTRREEGIRGFDERREAARLAVWQPIVGCRAAKTTVHVADINTICAEDVSRLRSRSFRFWMCKTGTLRDAVADEYNLNSPLNPPERREGVVWAKPTENRLKNSVKKIASCFCIAVELLEDIWKR